MAVVRWREAISIGGVCELAVVEKLRMIVDKQEESVKARQVLSLSLFQSKDEPEGGENGD